MHHKSQVMFSSISLCPILLLQLPEMYKNSDYLNIEQNSFSHRCHEYDRIEEVNVVTPTYFNSCSRSARQQNFASTSCLNIPRYIATTLKQFKERYLIKVFQSEKKSNENNYMSAQT